MEAVTVLPYPATGQATQPNSLSINPIELKLGDCFLFHAGNATGMTLDVLYRYNYGPPQIIQGWPVLDAKGEARLCTDANTPKGIYSFIALRNTLSSNWFSLGFPEYRIAVQVESTLTYRTPRALTVSPPEVNPGQCYTVTVENAADMTLNVAYRFNEAESRIIYQWPVLDSNGQARICTDALTAAGSYRFVLINNVLSPVWQNVSASITVRSPLKDRKD